ncbi:TPA: hypothetical protein ACF3EV_002601 [Enterococcus faecium]
MNKIAIVTGASSGLGREFVGAIVDELPEINEIWLIARREELLRSIAKRYPTKKNQIITFGPYSRR